MVLIILYPILNDKSNKLREEMLVIFLVFVSLFIIALTISGTAAIIKKWFKVKKSEMCIANISGGQDWSDEQPLQSEIDWFLPYWNRESAFSEFSYFEPIKNNVSVEMGCIEGSSVYV